MKKKRAVSDIPIFLDASLFSDLRKIVKSIQWPYKTNIAEFHLRDQALFSLLLLTGLRISEALALKRIQLRVYEQEIVIVNARTLKNGLLRPKIVCPKTGGFAWFTECLEHWLQVIPGEENYLFPSGTAYGFQWDKPLSRKRAFWIVKTTINRFPHWFRAITETVYGRLIFNNDAWKLKQFMGLKRLDSTTPYVKGSWEENLKSVYHL